MGYYIETGKNRSKAKFLIDNYQAKEVSLEKAREEFDGDHDTVCVVDNPAMGFEAAGFAFDRRELEAFSSPKDYRPKTWLQMPKSVAARMSNYS